MFDAAIRCEMICRWAWVWTLRAPGTKQAFVEKEQRRKNKPFLPEGNVQDKTLYIIPRLEGCLELFFNSVPVKLAGVSVGEQGHSSESEREGGSGGLHTGMFWLAGRALLHCSLGWYNPCAPTQAALGTDLHRSVSLGRRLHKHALHNRTVQLKRAAGPAGSGFPAEGASPPALHSCWWYLDQVCFASKKLKDWRLAGNAAALEGFDPLVRNISGEKKRRWSAWEWSMQRWCQEYSLLCSRGMSGESEGR